MLAHFISFLNNSILSQNQCICSGKYTWNSNKTSCSLKNILCPKDSLWNVDKLQCFCTLEGQHVINGKCQACLNNQSWNGTVCQCPNGLFLIDQICKACPLASSYNGKKCQCHLGYFQISETCQQCDPTCSKCTGPSSNQCTSCVDITYEFKNGYCSKSSTCPLGTYLNGQTCSRCRDYCQSCASQLECMKCTLGFELKLHIIQNMDYSTCESVCGDGKKVDLEECDDGNIISDDGCNGECQVENGWSCSGGTSGQASKCIHGIPTRSFIQAKGAVTQVGKVVQGVRMSHFPACFIDRDCVDCYRILDVKVVEGDMPTQVKINYLPNSQGQFVIDYSFGGIITSTIFKYQIQINKNLPASYVSCFNAEDYSQQIVGVIDSALLAKFDQTGQLTLDQILGEGNYWGETLDKIFD